MSLVRLRMTVVWGMTGALHDGATGLAFGASTGLIVQHAVWWWVSHRKLGLRTPMGRPFWHRTILQTRFQTGAEEESQLLLNRLGPLMVRAILRKVPRGSGS
jgi:hypothetical protein